MIKHKLRNEPRKSKSPLFVLGGIFAAGLAVLFVWAFNILSALWQKQATITDPELDVVVSTGKMIHQDVIVYYFGLTNGANIATIPFSEMRESLLKKIPNILDVKIERRLPNRVTVEVTEREPIARITDAKSKHLTGKVTDAEGVVFRYFQGVDHLPLIRDCSAEPVGEGKRLSGMSVAALQLISVANEPEFSGLKAVEVSTEKQDFLLVSFADASRAKIAWDRMGENSRKSRESLKQQLTRLMHAMDTGINTPSTIWTATDYGKPGRVYANNPAFSQ
jgi:hypothetical protein